MDDKLIYELVKERDLSSDNFIILRYQMRKTRAVNFDGYKFTYYYDDDRGIGIQAISKEDRIAFCYTDLIDYWHLKKLINMSILLSNQEVSTLYIPGLYNYYYSKEIKNINNIYSEANLNIDLYKDLIIKENEYAKNIMQCNDINTYLLLGYEIWEIFNSNGLAIKYDYSFSSLRHNIKLETNQYKYKFQVSMSGKNGEVLTNPIKNEVFKSKTKCKAERIRNVKNYYENLDNYEKCMGNISKIVFDYDFLSVLIHEMIGHSVEEDLANTNNFLCKNNKLALNKIIAPPYFNVVDNPNYEYWGYQPYDLDGNKRNEVEIIRKGVVKDGLYSLYYSDNLKNVNFSDRVDSYKDMPLPRMSNLTLRIDNVIYRKLEKELTDLSELRDLLINEEYISENEEVLYLLGSNGGKVNVKDNVCKIMPEYCCILSNDKTKVLPQRRMKINIEQVCKSALVGIGKVNDNSYFLCKKKGQIVNVSGGSNMYVLFSKFNIDFE
ncbi:MAG: hypothetical protein E7205_09075 [Tissierellaceae bacterium]|jgi:TldD protein|nr:hypothetical protein [Tissierellaceae bacterium]